MGSSYVHWDNAALAEVETASAPTWCDTEEDTLRQTPESTGLASDRFTDRLLAELSEISETLYVAEIELDSLADRNHGTAPAAPGANGANTSASPIGRFAEIGERIETVRRLAYALRDKAAKLNQTH